MDIEYTFLHGEKMAGHDLLWTKGEDELVIKLHDTDISITEIAKQIPNRSKGGVAYRIVILRRMKKLL